MGDIGEIYKAMNEHKKQQKKERLSKSDDTGWMKHSTHHWFRDVGGFTMDYWPSTGTIRYRGETSKIWRVKIQKILKDNGIEYKGVW